MRISISCRLRTKELIPLNKTEDAYTDSTFKLAAGFAEWLLAAPLNKTGDRALKCFDILSWIASKLSVLEDRIMPRCSVLLDSVIEDPFRTTFIGTTVSFDLGCMTIK